MRRNFLHVYIHFVWATWDRLPLITKIYERRLHRQIAATCEDCGCQVLAIGGLPDHVHLLVTMSTTTSISDLMKHVKGSSSYFVTETLTPGEWFAWQGSYGALSVCERDINKITKYIANQQAHHAENSLWPFAEKTQDDIETS